MTQHPDQDDSARSPLDLTIPAELAEEEAEVHPSILVPQADTLEHIKRIVALVAAGHQSTDDLAADLAYVGRQGQFYRRAGVQLGMLNEIGKSFNVSSLGFALLSAKNPGQEKRLMIDGFMSNPALSAAYGYLKGDPRGRSRGELALWLERNTSLNSTTSRRRVQSLINWMTELGLAYLSGGRYGRVVARRVPAPTQQALGADRRPRKPKELKQA